MKEHFRILWTLVKRDWYVWLFLGFMLGIIFAKVVS